MAYNLGRAEALGEVLYNLSEFDGAEEGHVFEALAAIVDGGPEYMNAFLDKGDEPHDLICNMAEDKARGYIAHCLEVCPDEITEATGFTSIFELNQKLADGEY